MKLSSKELLQLVRETAREEVRKEVGRQVKALVAECLSEQFLQTIVQEQLGQRRAAPVSQPRRGSLREALSLEEPQDEESPPPRPRSAPIALSAGLEQMKSRLQASDNPLGFIYDDLITEDTVSQRDFAPLPEMSDAVELVRKADAAQAAKAPMKDPAYEEARLKRFRESLERRA